MSDDHKQVFVLEAEVLLKTGMNMQRLARRQGSRCKSLVEGEMIWESTVGDVSDGSF